MPRKSRNIPCSHTTRAGKPCRAWAVEGTDPPACSAHAGRNVAAGAPPGNQDARILSGQELAGLLACATGIPLDEEITRVRAAIHRAVEFILDDSRELDPDTFLRAVGVIFQGTRAVAYLLRRRQDLAAAVGRTYLDFLNQALEGTGEEWDIEP